jgi:hypothetical protein
MTWQRHQKVRSLKALRTTNVAPLHQRPSRKAHIVPEEISRSAQSGGQNFNIVAFWRPASDWQADALAAIRDQQPIAGLARAGWLELLQAINKTPS